MLAGASFAIPSSQDFSYPTQTAGLVEFISFPIFSSKVLSKILANPHTSSFCIQASMQFPIIGFFFKFSDVSIPSFGCSQSIGNVLACSKNAGLQKSTFCLSATIVLPFSFLRLRPVPVILTGM